MLLIVCVCLLQSLRHTKNMKKKPKHCNALFDLLTSQTETTVSKASDRVSHNREKPHREKEAERERGEGDKEPQEKVPSSHV